MPNTRIPDQAETRWDETEDDVLMGWTVMGTLSIDGDDSEEEAVDDFRSGGRLWEHCSSWGTSPRMTRETVVQWGDVLGDVAGTNSEMPKACILWGA